MRTALLEAICKQAHLHDKLRHVSFLGVQGPRQLLVAHHGSRIQGTHQGQADPKNHGGVWLPGGSNPPCQHRPCMWRQPSSQASHPFLQAQALFIGSRHSRGLLERSL